MPSADEILQSLGYLARNHQRISILWHVAVYSLLLFLLLAKRKPSNRFIGCFLALLLLSVSFFAWHVENPFTGMFFLIAGCFSFFLSVRAESKEISPNPSFLMRAAGSVILFFGIIYPHFLGPHLFVYLYAAPIGIIPCATLLVVTGFSLLFLLRQSLKCMWTLLIADLFYGLFGVFRLQVYIDVILLFASCALFVQLILQQKVSSNKNKPSLQKIPLFRTTMSRLIFISIFSIVSAYVIYPWLCSLSASSRESKMKLPGDEIVENATEGYTMGATITASPSKVWPWLLQMGQGKGGFYTHEWVEDIFAADIHNADSILPEFQALAPGDTVWLTPDPYLSKKGQHMIVALIDSPFALVYKQVSPGGSIGTWAFFLQQHSSNSTRLLFRRRGINPTTFDRISKPGYYFMDNGMLSGIKQRAELAMLPD